MTPVLSSWLRGHAPPRGERLAALLVVASSTALVAWLGLRTHTFTIDSYVYMAKARSLAEGRGFAVPWNDGVDRKFFWGYSMALALPVRLFGDRGFVVLACILQVLLLRSYRLLLQVVEERPTVRLLALALLAFDPLLVWWGTVPASEPLFTLLAVETVRRALVARSLPAGRFVPSALATAAFAGLAILTRAEGVLLLLLLLAILGRRLFVERRFVLTLGGLALAVVPELAHVWYLGAHSLEARSASEYVDELFGHLHDVELRDAAWENLRAPYWTVFRFDTEKSLYATFFPKWLVSAQALVANAYLVALALAIASGIRRRSAAFWSALGVSSYAVLHALWYYRYERFMTVTTPFAALVFAWAVDAALRAPFARARTVGAATLAGAGAAAVVTCALYGRSVSEMHAERLASREHGRDYAKIAGAIDRADPERRPIVTDMGPYLAYYAVGRASFLDGESEFYVDSVPWCMDGRELLAAEHASLVVSKEKASAVAASLDLTSDDYSTTFAPVTMLFLHLRNRGPAEQAAEAKHDFASAPLLGGKLAVNSVRTDVRSSPRCGELRVTVRADELAPLEPGDELFVHVNAIGHEDERLDTERGVANGKGASLEETFVVHLPARTGGRVLEVWVGLWNRFTGVRARLDRSGAERIDADRVLATEVPVAN